MKKTSNTKQKSLNSPGSNACATHLREEENEDGNRREGLISPPSTCVWRRGGSPKSAYGVNTPWRPQCFLVIMISRSV